MRHLFIIIFVLAFAKANSQQTIPQDTTQLEIKEKIKIPTAVDAVRNFFKNFHARDTTALKESMLTNMQLTSMIIKGEERKISTITTSLFLKDLIAIPDSIPFEERLIEISYDSDTQIATVTTTYEFYYNKFLSHVGTNKFTLFFIDDKWIITSIADTRIFG
ncbi:hypothetical protein [uncultured Nonlabens sp.]|uniref:hypothetical protein n=1 Tax=uncultured Nonlabens sp. TaxID=859306 RepID=UPI002635AEA2|nr:hypothetical protein [uncultured Nonlabens sp.]